MTDQKHFSFDGRCILAVLILALFVCFAPESSWSMSKAGHIKDWEAVTGLKGKTAEGKAALEELWTTAQNLIDKTSDVYQSEVKSNFKWFSYGTVHP